MSRHCISCDSPLTGRSDKKFCNYNCRSEFNNQLNRDRNMLMRKINKILNQNRIILRRFYVQEDLVLTSSILSAAGFNFKYFSHQETDTEGTVYIFCYEYGYANINKKQISLKNCRHT